MKKQNLLFQSVIFLSFLFLHIGVVYSQTHEVSYRGIVREALTKEPLPGSTITLQTSDGILLVGHISEDNGKFSLAWQGELPSAADSLTLHCSFIGFDDYSIRVPITTDYNVGIVELKESSEALQEVVITTKRSAFKFDRGSYLAKISHTSLSNLSSANDVLKRLPLLTGDNGAFAVRGRGQALIYINEREVRDHSEIQNIDASQIESIRIITDPGISYPIGTNAVIKITLKKSHIKHFGLTAESQLYQRKRMSGYHTLRANYTQKNLSVSSVLRAESTRLDPETDINYQIFRPLGDLSFGVEGRSSINRSRYTFDTGLNYDINEKQSLGYYLSASIDPAKTSVLENIYQKNGNIEGTHTSINSKKMHEVNGTLYYMQNLKME